MDTKGKVFSLLFVIILVVSSLMIVESVFAQSIPKPSAPQFTVKYADHSYDVPSKTISSTDPYTGKTITTTQPSYHVQNFTIDVTIKNQPFPSTVGGNTSSLHYTVDIKGHFQNEWYAQNNQYYGEDYPTQSNSEYTMLSFPANYPADGQIDIRVQAILIISYFNYEHIIPLPETTPVYGDFSNTQTITIPETANTSPNPSPTVPEFSSAIVLVIMLIVLLLAISVFKRKNRLIK